MEPYVNVLMTHIICFFFLDIEAIYHEYNER
jgi:hypothetical protein